jgi:hypothetical protein
LNCFAEGTPVSVEIHLQRSFTIPLFMAREFYHQLGLQREMTDGFFPDFEGRLVLIYEIKKN